YPIIFGDIAGYTIVERVGMSVRALMEPYAETNTVSLLARRRVGGFLSEAYRVKVLKCA
ncbi:MAG: phage major capsid protein, partial [Chloroflexota bacterium]|nr:phage major capsid protein [Chloroflexota bacterium]